MTDQDNQKTLVHAPRRQFAPYWLPLAYFLLGFSSIFLLLFINHLSERERANAALVDAMMDVQGYASTTHLWTEEAIYGDPDVDVRKQLTDMDEAVNILNATLRGGKSEHGAITKPLKDPAMRAQAAEVISLFTQFKAIALARLEYPVISQIGSPSDKRFDAVYLEMDGVARKMEDNLEQLKVADRTDSRRLFLGIILIWTVVVTTAALGIWNRELRRIHAEDALIRANKQLASQAEELTGHRERLEEQVSKRTAELSLAGERLRELSSRLLAAQELERKRISMELHDELGQALYIMKLRLRNIERGLGADQPEIREGCEGMLLYIDQVIEDVRRLSLYLSPTVLEELGITQALEWLIENFSKNPAMKFSSSIEDIDRLFPRKKWITIYRVVQEALTNVVKHAGASSVSLDIRRQDDAVVFSVEDNGKGFEPGKAESKARSEIGLGLSTMDERVRMLGGTFDLASRKGDGTHITFRIPVDSQTTGQA
jgi:signal transduction histidine kinase